MDFKKIYLTVSVIALTCSQYAVASPLNNISHTHTQHTLELKPISNSFQIAAAIFLPDKGDDLGFNGRELNDNHGNTPQIDLCSKFPLSACPANAKCSKCTSGNKFKLSGCNEGFKLSAGTCVAKSCAEINSAYRADVPVNQVCSTISTYGKTCYQTCKTIDFSGYPITSCPANATCTDHPDCATTATKKGNCSPIKKKVTTCTLPSQKLNANASGCVNKDDTCPSTYFKTCETGTTGTARYTELGSACYQCKPPCDASIYKYNSSNCLTPSQAVGRECGGKFETCIKPLKYLYSDRTIDANVIPGKTPIAIVTNENLRLAVAIDYFRKAWGSSGIDIPTLKNTPQSGMGVWVGNDPSDKICDDEMCLTEPNGKTNTKKIVDFAGSLAPAAYNAYYYRPAACLTTSWCGPTNWFLSSTQEAYTYFNNRKTIHSMLRAIGRLPDDWRYTRDDFYVITSNEISSTEPGFLYMDVGIQARGIKDNDQNINLIFIKY